MQTLFCIKTPAKIENLSKLMNGVLQCARENHIDKTHILKIELALEEALINVINYSYQSRSGDMQVSCLIDSNNQFIIEIVDQGIPFDVLSTDEPDIESEVADRKVGGLGIYIIKKTMRDVEYERKENSNILRLTV